MKAAMYIRVSTGEQVEEGHSLEAQHDILMNIIEKKGLQLYRVYSDPGISGGTIKKRPGLQLLLEDMKKGRFDTVLVHKQDRLTRNVGDLITIIDLVNKLNVRLIIPSFGAGSETMEVDTKSPMGKMFLIIMGAVNQMYIDNLREETLKGLTKKAQKGGKHISRPPLGYEFDEENELVLVESEAQLVRTVFQKYLEGLGVVKISNHMNDISRRKEGGWWDTKNVREVLKNPTYAGYNHFKPDEWEEDKRIMTPGNHTPIVSKEEFELVKKHMERRANGEMSKRSFEYAYSGILKCGECGANYTGNTSVQGDTSYKSYRCYQNYVRKICTSPTISERPLNSMLFEKIMLLGLEVVPKKKETKKEMFDLQKEVDISNKRRKNWMMALGDGKLTSDDYAMLIEEEDTRMKQVYDALKEVATAEYEPELSIDELKQKMMNLRDMWEFIEADTQKQIIQSMFKKIVIRKDENGWSIVELQTV